MNGSAFSTSCPYHGGPSDIAGEKSVIDWLNGRVRGEDAGGRPMRADWHDGTSAMIGKSYDGTLANGVAATGVEGVRTIVPISAISSWYDYPRTGGITEATDYRPGCRTTSPTPTAAISARPHKRHSTRRTATRPAT